MLEEGQSISVTRASVRISSCAGRSTSSSQIIASGRYQALVSRGSTIFALTKSRARLAESTSTLRARSEYTPCIKHLYIRGRLTVCVPGFSNSSSNMYQIVGASVRWNSGEFNGRDNGGYAQLLKMGLQTSIPRQARAIIFGSYKWKHGWTACITASDHTQAKAKYGCISLNHCPASLSFESMTREKAPEALAPHRWRSASRSKACRRQPTKRHQMPTGHR
jgi:hypothetical protein